MATRGQTAQLKRAFLVEFRLSGNISRACVASGAARRQVYEWKEKDRRFLAAFQIAETESLEHLEGEAFRRAVEGTDKPIYQGGRKVGVVREFSDTLLIFLLKARDPEKYRDTQRADIRILIAKIADREGLTHEEATKAVAEAERMLTELRGASR